MANKKKRGRPSAITQENKRILLGAIEDGVTVQTACALAGISQSTYYLHKTKGDFSEDIKKAEAEAEARSVRIITEAARKVWQAAAWWLERNPRTRKTWAKRSDLGMTSPSGLTTTTETPRVEFVEGQGKHQESESA